MVGVFPDGDATEEVAAFKAAAQALRSEFEFGLVTDASLLPEVKGCVLMCTRLNTHVWHMFHLSYDVS